MPLSNSFQQFPLRHGRILGAHVCSHSGEFIPRVIDLTFSGHGPALRMVRQYRSALSDTAGAFGRGWSFDLALRVERVKAGMVYHDGEGRSFLFPAVSSTVFTTPDGMYARMLARPEGIALILRDGTTIRFENPEMGGRVLSITDNNANALTFVYSADTLTITDALQHSLSINFEGTHIREVKDSAGRVWDYAYDAQGCLSTVTLPADTNEKQAKPTTIQYAYDALCRLISITDPKGQTFLRNTYDAKSRIAAQDLGAQHFGFIYEPVSPTPSGVMVYRTQVTSGDGSTLALEHTVNGQVITETRRIPLAALTKAAQETAAKDGAPQITRASYNRHGEITSLTLPSGRGAQMIYDEGSDDYLARGNLTQIQYHAPIASKTPAKTLKISYEPHVHRPISITWPQGVQRVMEYDERGNLIHRKTISPRKGIAQSSVETFSYNAAGQLLQSISPAGVTTSYDYTLPSKMVNRSAFPVGRLSKVTRQDGDAKAPSGSASYDYDAAGNVVSFSDGKTHFRYDYNALGKVTNTTRLPDGASQRVYYDPNNNARDIVLHFDHYEFDGNTNAIVRNTSTVTKHVDYDRLDRSTRVTYTDAAGKSIAYIYDRDAAGRIVREVQPMGNIINYQYAGDVLTSIALGTGTKEEAISSFAYNTDGTLVSRRDNNGNEILVEYDDDGNPARFTYPDGSVMTQAWSNGGFSSPMSPPYGGADPILTHVMLSGDPGRVDAHGQPVPSAAATLSETWYEYDGVDDLTRLDRAWRDPQSGQSLGNSAYDGRQGVTSTAFDFIDVNANSHISHLFNESPTPTATLSYDAAGWLTSVVNAIGQSTTASFDVDGNPTDLSIVGAPLPNAPAPRSSAHFSFGALGQLNTIEELGRGATAIEVNSLGQTISYTDASGVQVKLLHDSFGRDAGRSVVATSAKSVPNAPYPQTITQRLIRDDNNRIASRINASGHTTQYVYDALNRLKRIVYADGTTADLTLDKSGNVTSIQDALNNRILQSFDVMGRLTQRNCKGTNIAQRFYYDGCGRLVSATGATSVVTRRFDTLDRLLEETQNGRTTQLQYDSKGNITRMVYPSGRTLSQTFDAVGRLTEIHDVTGGRNDLIAHYDYRFGSQPATVRLGNSQQGNFTYDANTNQLTGVQYSNGMQTFPTEKRQYGYDQLGNRISESAAGKTDEHYFYDSANRLVAVQYGSAENSATASNFHTAASPVHEVQYTLTPAGNWDTVTLLTSTQTVLEQWQTQINARDAYTAIGSRKFEYDANGNRIRETGLNGNVVEKRYQYDALNRLVKVQCLDSSASITSTVDYVYDALNRQIQRRVTAGHAATVTTDRVWLGGRLIEEWENGQVVRSYVYGAQDAQPVQMAHITNAGTSTYYYLLNGRGLVAALTDTQGATVERYSYDVMGTLSVSEINGQIPITPTALSPLGNNVIGLGQLWDGSAGLIALSEMRHLSPTEIYDSTSGQRLVHTNPNWDAIPGSVGPGRLNMGNPNWDVIPGSTGPRFSGHANSNWNGVPGSSMFAGQGISPESPAGRMGFSASWTEKNQELAAGYALKGAGLGIGFTAVVAIVATGVGIAALPFEVPAAVIIGAYALVVGAGSVATAYPIAKGNELIDDANNTKSAPIIVTVPNVPPEKHGPKEDDGWGDDSGSSGSSGVIDPSRLLGLLGGDPGTGDDSSATNSSAGTPLQNPFQSNIDGNPRDDISGAGALHVDIDKGVVDPLGDPVLVGSNAAQRTSRF